MGASAAAKAVAGALRRTGKSQKSGKDLKGGIKPPTNLVETTPRTVKNAQRAGEVVGRTVLKRGSATLGAYKVSKSATSGKFVKVSRSQQRNQPTLTDRVFRPMTRKQAAAVSAVMRDPNLPTRKLSPRP